MTVHAVRAVSLTAPSTVIHARVAPMSAAERAWAHVKSASRSIAHSLHLDAIERRKMGERCVEVDDLIDQVRARHRAERRSPTGIAHESAYQDAVRAAMAVNGMAATYRGRLEQRNAAEHVTRAVGEFDAAPALAAQAIIARADLSRAAYDGLVRPIRLRGIDVPDWSAA